MAIEARYSLLFVEFLALAPDRSDAEASDELVQVLEGAGTIL